MKKKKTYTTKTGKITATGKIDKPALEIIDVIAQVFPGCSGFYIPPKKKKINMCTKHKKRKPLLRSHKILIALLLMLLAVIACTALFSCTKATAPVVVDGWNMHYDVPVDTCGVGR
jgi:hypothetical protein